MSGRPRARSAGRRFERVFVLRVWSEAGSAAIRGSVVELASDRRFFFTKLADLRDFLSLRLEADLRDP
jgi:hypothetical protein